MVDTTSGKVQYAVISFGGFLGLGDKLFAYPLEKFERTTEQLKSKGARVPAPSKLISVAVAR